MRALDLQAEDRLELEEQDDAAATYAEKIEPGERRLDPARPAAELALRVRALTPHVGAYLQLDEDSRPRRAAGARGRGGAGGGGDGGAGRRPAARLWRGRAGAGDRCKRPAASRWRPRPTCADTRFERRAGWDRAGPGARLRSAARDLRAGRLHRARLPRGRGGAARRRPRARPGAAHRLWRGPAARNQRRGDREARRTLAADARPAGDRRPPPRPLRAALRRRHPRPRRRRPGGRAGQESRSGARRRPRQRRPAPGGEGTRRARRGPARRRLDSGARLRRPLGAALAGADVVGGARRRRRPLAARRLQPARGDRLSDLDDRPRADDRDPGRVRGRGPRARRAPGRWRPPSRSSSRAGPGRTSPPGSPPAN